VALWFFDEQPDVLAEGFRSFEYDHHVGEPGGQVVFPLLGDGPLIMTLTNGMLLLYW
jgi:hypothetical protein